MERETGKQNFLEVFSIHPLPHNVSYVVVFLKSRGVSFRLK